MLLPTATRRLEANAKPQRHTHTHARTHTHAHTHAHTHTHTLVLISQPPCAAVIALFRGKRLLAQRPLPVNEYLSLNGALLGWERASAVRTPDGPLNLTKIQRATRALSGKKKGPFPKERLWLSHQTLLLSNAECISLCYQASVGKCRVWPTAVHTYSSSPSASVSLFLSPSWRHSVVPLTKKSWEIWMFLL